MDESLIMEGNVSRLRCGGSGVQSSELLLFHWNVDFQDLLRRAGASVRKYPYVTSSGTKEWDDTALQNPLSLKKGPDAM
ncbi:hypothetical protein MHYP_G00347480 [Metynnis hypsauchen]